MAEYKKEDRQKFRKVSPRLWNDRKFRALERPPPNAQHLFLYLLTNPGTSSVPGLYRGREVAMADDLDWPLKGFRAAFDQLRRAGMAEADWEAGLVYLPNALKYDLPANPNVINHWGKVVRSDLPECGLLFRAVARMKEVLTEELPGKTWVADALAEAFPESFLRGLAQLFEEQSAEPLPKRLPQPLPKSGTGAGARAGTGAGTTTTTGASAEPSEAGPAFWIENEPRNAFPGDFLATQVAHWRPTADGLWAWIQHQREESGLERERARPPAFDVAMTAAIADVGQEAVERAWFSYRKDQTIRATEWPTAVFILPSVFDVRAGRKESA